MALHDKSVIFICSVEDTDAVDRMIECLMGQVGKFMNGARQIFKGDHEPVYGVDVHTHWLCHSGYTGSEVAEMFARYDSLSETEFPWGQPIPWRESEFFPTYDEARAIYTPGRFIISAATISDPLTYGQAVSEHVAGILAANGMVLMPEGSAFG